MLGVLLEIMSVNVRNGGPARNPLSGGEILCSVNRSGMNLLSRPNLGEMVLQRRIKGD